MLREETLRYLRYSNQFLTDEQEALIDGAIAEVIGAAEPRTVHRVFDLIETDGVLGSMPRSIFITGICRNSLKDADDAFS
jgi:hypothetical protein